MDLPQTAEAATDSMLETAQQAGAALMRFARFERNLAAVCILTPVLLLVFDDGPTRDSISAYYSMKESQWFYVPLTSAAMLFIVNGIVKNRSLYNVLLGALLAGVVLFNHDATTAVHIICAIGFFGGNALVILIYSSKKQLWFKALLVAIVALAMLGHFVLGWFSLFWAEWISLALIGLHYILESWEIFD